MKILFFGTPNFAIPSLRALANGGFTMAGVVTQPSRAHGRGARQVMPPPIAIAARDLKLQVIQTDSPTDPEFLKRVRAMHPDAIAVVAYGKLLSDQLLNIAPLGGWNLHPSLLPRWRGPAPIHRTVYAGDSETGVTIIKMTSTMDGGPVALQEKIPVDPRATRGSLEEKLAVMGADALSRTLEAVKNGTVSLSNQSDTGTTSAPVIESQERQIRWEQSAVEIDRLIRALLPTPGAYFMLQGTRVKVYEAEPAAASSFDENLSPGVLLERKSQESHRVACGKGSIWIRTVQPEGKSEMNMDSFISGRRMKLEDTLNQ